MPASRIETKTLEKIATIAASISGIGATRVKTGFIPWSDSEEWLAQIKALTVEAQGYFWVTLKTVRGIKRGVQHDLEFLGELAVPIAKETSTTLVSAWEFALSLRDALELTGNYATGEAVPMVSVDLAEVRALEKGYVAIFSFGGRGGGQMTAVDP